MACDMRLFIGLRLPVDVRKHVVVGIPGLPKGCRRVYDESLHITLRYVGSADAELEARLVDSLKGSSLGRQFDVQLGSGGVFQGAGRGAVVWCGVASGELALLALAAEVDRRVLTVGCAPDRLPFKAHVTVARSRLELGPTFVERVLQMPSSRVFEVAEVVLFGSKQGPHGPIYDVRSVFLLGV